MFKRDDAFSIEIQDPEMNDESPIVLIKNINEKMLLAFKESSIYKIITADSIDPENTRQDTAHTYEKIADFGTSSVYLARIFLQFESIVEIVYLGEEIKPIVIEKIWYLNEQLLLCAQLHSNIREQLQDVIVGCNLTIEKNKSTGKIPPLPKVKNLESDAKMFLSVGKQFLIDFFKLLALLTNLPITDKNEAHFDKHIVWLNNNITSPYNIAETIAADLPWMRQLAECRNAVEHPSDGQQITITNTKLCPGNKFSLPSWSYDLTKKLGIKNSDIQIDIELDVYLNNMFHMLEEILFYCILDKMHSKDIFCIYARDDNEINPKCPIKYYIGMK